MSNSSKYLELLKQNNDKLKEIHVLSNWELNQLQSMIEGLFSFAKFKKGDVVEMSETYPVSQDESWGWMAYRHLLSKGSKVTIEEVDFNHGTFIYSVSFSEQTWVDEKDKIHPRLTNDGMFILSEKWLKASS